jgi:hypothetical protein
MDGDDRPGARAEPLAHGGRVEVVAARIEVGKDGNPLLVKDADDRAHVGDGRHDHFVARAQFQGGDGDVHGGRARRAGKAVLERVVPAELLQEGLRLRALPVKQGILPDHGGEPGQFGFAPAPGLRHRFVDERL